MSDSKERFLFPKEAAALVRESTGVVDLWSIRLRGDEKGALVMADEGLIKEVIERAGLRGDVQGESD